MPDQHPTTPAARSDARPSDPDATAPGTTRPTNSEFGLGAPAVPGELGALGPYRVLKELGRGGMGAVYRAIDTRLDRTVALKVLLPELAADPAARERFLREAKAAAKLSHDNVVTVYEADERDGVPYIAMQLLQGYPLDQYLKTKGAPPLAHVVRIGIEAARGLAAAHALGLVHRDIKPANLWLESPNGRVKVLDFGLAKPVGTDAELTKSGAVVGTPAFMSPEQARGLKVDHRTDVFSLGAVLYRVLAGRNPFAGANMMAVLMALGTEDPTPLRELNAEVPTALAELIHRMLAKKPDDRPQSAQEVAHALRAVLAQPSAEVSTSQPVVVQAVPVAAPMEVSAVAASAFANLMDDDADAHTEHEAEPVQEAGAGGSRKGLLLAGGALALVAVVAVAVVLGTGGKKPDDTAKGGDPVGVPPKPNEKNPPKKGGELPAVPAWKPIPIGESPFDKLDPNEIPKDERFDYQPKELVAVIGSHARRHWGSVCAVAMSADGTKAVTADRLEGKPSEVIVWDVATHKPLSRFQIQHGYASRLRFAANDTRIEMLVTGGPRVQEWDISTDPPKPVPHPEAPGPEAQEASDWIEKDRTLVLECSGNTGEFGLIAVTETGFKEVSRVKTRISGGPARTIRAAPEANVVVYITPEKTLRRATVKNAQLADDTELPIKLHPELLYLNGLSPNGQWLVLEDEKGLVCWDISGKEPKVRWRFDGYRGSVRFSPCGRWAALRMDGLFLVSNDNVAKKEPLRLDKAGTYWGDVRFSQDGNKLIHGASEGFVRLWDLSGVEPKELSPFDPATAVIEPHWVQSVSLDGQRGRLLVPRYDTQTWNRYQLWNLNGTKPTALAPFDPPIAGRMSSLGQERFVQSAPGHNHVSRLYQIKNDLFEQIGEPFGEPNTIGFPSPVGDLHVAYCRPSGGPADAPFDHLEGWDLNTAPPSKKWSQSLSEYSPFYHHDNRVWFSGDGRWFATTARGEKADGPWRLVVWRNTGTKPQVHTTLPCTWQLMHYRAALSPDGRYLAHVPEHSSSVTIVDLRTLPPREIQRIEGDLSKYPGFVSSLAFHPDGKHLAYGSTLGAGVLDVTTGKVVWEWAAPGTVYWLDWAADGRHLVTHNSNKTVYVLRVDPTFPAERKAAELVLSLLGTVETDAAHGEVSTAKALPRNPFRLTSVNLLNNQQVTDAALEQLRTCDRIESVALGGAMQITDAGVAHLRGCTRLRVLGLTTTAVTDAGLATFDRCPDLEYVALPAKATDAGLAHFRNCTKLHTLMVGSDAITDTGLAPFQRCANLQTLLLSGCTQVTDAGVAGFAACTKLTQLNLARTKVTLAGVQQLAKALPNCRIEWDGGTIEPGKK